MHYYKYSDDETYEYAFQCFAELDDDYYCLRTVYHTPEGLINSFTNGVEHLHGLPEGSWEDILDDNEPSNAQEFEQIWTQSLLPFEKDWQVLKNNYQLNQKVTLKIVCFYPQGILLKFDNPLFDKKFYALAHHQQSLKKIGKEKMYPNNQLELMIQDFDDVNKLVLVH